MLQIGQRYRHYKKGTIYEIITLAKHTEDLEEMVVYQNRDEKDKVWVRPRSMFEEKVVHNGQTVQRFQLIED